MVFLLPPLRKMASVTTATSEWIQFFKDAGIPPGLASNYAVSFVDNRIQKNMLNDLSKDIMMDLGITVIGDIIAILKHAKHVYRQDLCKMTSEAISSGQTSVQAELRRSANTPATRMIANALSRDSPPSTPAHRPDNRLSVTISNKGVRTGASQPATPPEDGVPVKRRRVTAEMEGKYVVNMPKGTTARSRRLLAQQAKKARILKRTSVFARLGSESKTDSSAANKVSGVFSRLDKAGGAENAEARDLASEPDDSDGEGSVLQYAGVLKRGHSPPSPKTPPALKRPALRRLRIAPKPLGQSDRTPTAPSSTSGPRPRPRLMRRLGRAPAAPVSPAAETQDSRVSTSGGGAAATLDPASPSPKVSSSTGWMDAAATVSVFKRLGAKKT